MTFALKHYKHYRMLEILSLLCVVIGLILLAVLSAIDLKIRLLPNELVAGFMACGLVFHTCLVFVFADITTMATGALLGAGTLYVIRAIANTLYGRDTLGLGDVKLMGAAGVWLGPYYILVALTTGALAGIVHGLSFALYIKSKSGQMPSLSTLSIPAGPGFAIGIIITGIVAFWHLPSMIFTW